jgi:hypothetical protein
MSTAMFLTEILRLDISSEELGDVFAQIAEQDHAAPLCLGSESTVDDTAAELAELSATVDRERTA